MATKANKPTIVGLKELRNNMEEYITRVGNGESIIVFRRTTPLFQLTPLSSGHEAGWETIIDFQAEFGEGMPIEELMHSIQKYGQKRKIS